MPRQVADSRVQLQPKSATHGSCASTSGGGLVSVVGKRGHEVGRHGQRRLLEVAVVTGRPVRGRRGRRRGGRLKQTRMWIKYRRRRKMFRAGLGIPHSWHAMQTNGDWSTGPASQPSTREIYQMVHRFGGKRVRSGTTLS